MSDVLYNDNGIPMVGYGSQGLMITTKGVPAGSMPKKMKIKNLEKPRDTDPETGTHGKNTYVEWGSGNTMPEDIEDYTGKIGVLQTGLRYNMKMILGQGVYPVKVLSFDEKGEEELEVVNEPKLRKDILSLQTLSYLEKGISGLLKFGIIAVELIPTSDGKKISGLNVINERYWRLTEANNKGVIEKIIVSGDWPVSPSKENTNTLDVLDEYNPMADLDSRIKKDRFKKSVVLLIRDNFSNQDYYPYPSWWSAKVAGWLDIAAKVPEFLIKMYENQITWKWHVKIPYAYWEKRFPRDKYKNEKERRDLINKEMDDIEKNLVGSENAHKALFSMFEVNASGKAEEAWEIEALDNKYKADDKLITSAVANSEILFTLLVNPTILGAAMPGSGPYSGGAGSGSDIREAFLVNIALSWLERQKIIYPMEMKYQLQGYQDIELRFKNTILKTLDNGSGTDKTIS